MRKIILSFLTNEAYEDATLEFLDFVEFEGNTYVVYHAKKLKKLLFLKKKE